MPPTDSAVAAPKKSMNVASLLRHWLEQACVTGSVIDGGGRLLLAISESVIAPDVVYHAAANRFEVVHPKWGEVPPILAVEVLSPNDKPGKVNAKIRSYLASSVRVVWLVDYEERQVMVYRPNQAFDILNESAELTGGDDLPGFACRVAELFRVPGDRPSAPVVPPPSA